MKENSKKSTFSFLKQMKSALWHRGLSVGLLTGPTFLQITTGLVGLPNPLLGLQVSYPLIFSVCIGLACFLLLHFACQALRPWHFGGSRIILGSPAMLKRLLFSVVCLVGILGLLMLGGVIPFVAGKLMLLAPTLSLVMATGITLFSLFITCFLYAMPGLWSFWRPQLSTQGSAPSPVSLEKSQNNTNNNTNIEMYFSGHSRSSHVNQAQPLSRSE